MDVKDLKPGDILLYSPARWNAIQTPIETIGWAISVLTLSPVCHAGLYMGNGEVAEEGFDGLKQYKLVDSFKDRRIYVRRLRNLPQNDINPVINIAKGYLDKNEGYGYADIILLAISILQADIEKLAFMFQWDIETNWLERFECLKKLAEAVRDFLKFYGGMICSQFVYTCYDEAGAGYKLRDQNCIYCGQTENTLLSYAEKYAPKAVSPPQGATIKGLYEEIVKKCEELLKTFFRYRTVADAGGPGLTELPEDLLETVKSLDDALRAGERSDKKRLGAPSSESYLIKPSDLYDRCPYTKFVGTITARDRLYGKNNEHLLPGEFLESAAGEFKLVYEKDGNLVLYGARDKSVIWESHTKGKPAWKTCMQPDGNFVVYEAENRDVWASGKYGNEYAGSVIIMQDNGNLVIYDRNGKVVWNIKDIMKHI